MGPLLDTVTWYQKQITVLDGKKKNKQTNKQEIIHFPKIEYPCSRTRSIHLAIAFLYHVTVADRANIATTPPIHVIDFLLTVWCYIAT